MLPKKLVTLAFIASLLLSAEIDLVSSLRCLDCTESNPNCRGNVYDTRTIGSEPCPTRCFVRRSAALGNKIVRGCDVRYNYTYGQFIPNNGCGYLNGEKWCWCDRYDNCNRIDKTIYL